MKINAPKGGSFGIPDQIKEQAERAKSQKEREPVIEKEPIKEDKPQDDEWDLANSDKTTKEEEPELTDDERAEIIIKSRTPISAAAFQKSLQEISPKSLLKAIGVDFQEDDLTSIIFKGYVEKEVPVVKLPNRDKPLTATLRLLQTQELDLVDELCAEDLSSTKMTNMGIENRRSIWTMAFGVTGIAGRPLTKPITDEKTGEPDKREMAGARRKALLAMAPGMIDEIVRRHTIMQMAYNTILFGDEGEELKK